MTLAEVLADPPLVHTTPSGKAEVLALEEWALTRIHASIARTSTTIETGLGASTAVFALVGTKHTCITPSADEVARFRDYASRRGLSSSSIEFIIGKSEDVLPSLSNTRYDLALIDGRHGFPAPIIDWFYITDHLNPQGSLVIDDVQIWPVSILVRYLQSAEDWRLEKLRGKTAFFTYLGGHSHRAEWDGQPNVAMWSRPSYVSVWTRRIQDYCRLARSGQVRAIYDRLLRRTGKH